MQAPSVEEERTNRFLMDLLIQTEDRCISVSSIGCERPGGVTSSRYICVREYKTIDAAAYLDWNLEKITGH